MQIILDANEVEDLSMYDIVEVVDYAIELYSEEVANDTNQIKQFDYWIDGITVTIRPE